MTEQFLHGFLRFPVLTLAAATSKSPILALGLAFSALFKALTSAQLVVDHFSILVLGNAFFNSGCTTSLSFPLSP